MCARFEVMKFASAVKVTAWTCALATDLDSQSVLSKSIFNLLSSHVPKNHVLSGRGTSVNDERRVLQVKLIRSRK